MNEIQYISIPDRPEDDPDPKNPYWQVVVEPPRRRDFLRVVFGRYQPQVRLTRLLTLARADKDLKDGYGPVTEQLGAKSMFLERLTESPGAM